MARLTFACIAGLLSIVAFAQGPAFAAEIRLLTAGAMRAVVIELLPEFESKTGHKVSIDNATAGTLAKRIEGGEAFDVAIITPKIVDDLTQKAKIAVRSRVASSPVSVREALGSTYTGSRRSACATGSIAVVWVLCATAALWAVATSVTTTRASSTARRTRAVYPRGSRLTQESATHPETN